MYSRAYIQGFMTAIKTAGALSLFVKEAATLNQGLTHSDVDRFLNFLKHNSFLDYSNLESVMSQLDAAGEQGVTSKAIKRLKELKRRGLPEPPPGTSPLTAREAERAASGAEGALLRKLRRQTVIDKATGKRVPVNYLFSVQRLRNVINEGAGLGYFSHGAGLARFRRAYRHTILPLMKRVR